MVLIINIHFTALRVNEKKSDLQEYRISHASLMKQPTVLEPNTEIKKRRMGGSLICRTH
jgi:hypothetical protein